MPSVAAVSERPRAPARLGFRSVIDREPARLEPGTPLQSANHGEQDLLVYAYGTPPEDEHAELLDSAL